MISIFTYSCFLDRLVLVGNHRDAWGYGAADPSSGTAVLVEVARVLGELKKEGMNFDMN